MKSKKAPKVSKYDMDKNYMKEYVLRKKKRILNGQCLKKDYQNKSSN